MTYTLSSVKIIKRVPKTEDNPFGCIIVDKIPVDKPSVIAFGGELALSERAANSYAKQIQTLLYEYDIHDIDVYSVVYNFGSRNAKLERAEQFRIAGRRLLKEDVNPIVKYEQDTTLNKMRKNEPIPNYVKQLFDILLLPRISNSDNQPLNKDEAIFRMRKNFYYGHCQGASTIWQMANYMHDKMLELGYSPDNIKEIQHELFVVQHSPVAPLTKQKFNTLSFASAEDTMMQYHNNMFADWVYENSADVIPSFFDKKNGNIFVAGHLQEIPFKEHTNIGLTKAEEQASPLTEDGQIIFSAERNAIVRAARKVISGEKIKSIAELTDGNGVDFKQLKQNGDTLYNVMLYDLRQQNLKPSHQK